MVSWDGAGQSIEAANSEKGVQGIAKGVGRREEKEGSTSQLLPHGSDLVLSST